MDVTEKLKLYRDHVTDCRACRACDGLENGIEDGFVNHPSPWAELAGSLSARLVVVGKDFSSQDRKHTHPDALLPTNKNLKYLVAAAGLTFDDIYLTNAILCWKPGSMSTQVKPQWVRNCASHLRRTIEIVAPMAVAGLGGDGYRATCGALGLKPRRLGDVVGEPPVYAPSGIAVFGLNHCGGLGIAHRSLCKQREDWAKIGTYLRDQCLAA